MRLSRLSCLVIVFLAWLILAPVAQAVPVGFGTEAFGETWRCTDQPITAGVVDGTWIWGPGPMTEGILEPYAESPDGKRMTQYFDKGRMEVTHPESDTTDLWYVTSGLLATELITGRLQVGDDQFVSRSPSERPVAGDPVPQSGPTYATFSNLLDLPGASRVGETIIERIDQSGTIEIEQSLADQRIALAVFDDVTGRNIAAPFWEFMTSQRSVFVHGDYVLAPLFDNPYYVTGRPITEPYWADAVVSGTSRLVLVQCFERRCLTYTPDNADGWQVELGNVGQHYHSWRYGPGE